MQKPTNLPFVTHTISDIDPADVGGETYEFIAGGNLNLGDVVFFSAANTVNKSTTAGDHDQVAGVVVGGTRTDKKVITGPDSIYGTLQVAAVNERVLVQINGIAKVVSGAAITIGQSLKPDTGTAGRAIAAVLGTGADQGKVIGRAVTTAGGAAVVVKALLSLS